MTEEKEKDSYIRIRIDAGTKDTFQKLCQEKSINSSMLIRKLIAQWIKEQVDMEIKNRRTTDIK